MKRAIITAAALATLMTADTVQAQTSSSRPQPVRRTTTRTSWHRTTTTRANNGNHMGVVQGAHKGWNKQEVTDTTHVHYGGYHRKRAPIRK